MYIPALQFFSLTIACPPAVLCFNFNGGTLSARSIYGFTAFSVRTHPPTKRRNRFT
jgi:hypothetical protein